jgi:serine protease Do
MAEGRLRVFAMHAARPSFRFCRIAAALAAVLLAPMLFPAAAGAQGPASVADIAARLQDTVVNISTTQTVKDSQDQSAAIPDPKGSPFEQFFDDFFDSPGSGGVPRKVTSLGSGFVYDPSGLIITNNHVIEGADEITINFTDGSKLKVTKVLGHDAKTDLALLKVDPDKPLDAVKFGDSSKMRVGDWVMAIGNPFGLGGTVTMGIVSATKRDINAGPYDDFIQTDAAINRGNSGGPLFNMNGEVIGVNTAIISPSGGSIGIGFAVPSNTALQVIEQLKKYGETRRGWLGVHVQNLSQDIAADFGLQEPKGALIAEVMPKSPAEKAGLKAGDIIVGIGDDEIDSMRDLPRSVAADSIGEAVPVKILRNGKTMQVTVTIGRLPAKEAEADSAGSVDEDDTQPDEESLLGITMTLLTPQLRKQHGIENNIDGVLVTAVAAGSPAAQTTLKPGDVIVEVTDEKVLDPEEVLTRVESVKRAGRKSVVFLISNGKGKLSFIALPVS